ncbi:Tectonic [Pseudolycoriella hygida]|uniref:Tectonic n=1 Tax=Pseudolycoriella hygida TaxID=35572 RepID=A0A9Q0MYZ5_9DIPT|nr:Tectonic [Pseudolycoriella hygida]
MKMQLLSVLMIVSLLSTTRANVKIGVSRLNKSTATHIDASVSTTAGTPKPNLTNQSVDTTTNTPTLTTATESPTTSTTVNNTSTTELNQISVNATRPFLDAHVPRTSRVKVSLDHYYCTCDLMFNFCDINCCCDNDCTDAMLSTFVCNEKEWSIYDFEFDGGLTSCEIRSDLFCVVGDNGVTKKAEYDVTLFSLRSKHKWQRMFAPYEFSDENRESYSSGDSILSFDDKTEEIEKFEIPYSLTGDYCNVNVPIKYMEDTVSRCLRTYDQNRAFFQEFQRQIKSTKVLKSRKVNLAMMMEHCTTSNNHCLEIEMFDCWLHISRDSCVNFNSTDMDETRMNTEIVVQFRHNFTNILNCKAFFIYINGEVAPNSFLHSVKIQFLQANESMINIHRSSGNIGYMQGLPIISAKMIPFNITTDDDNNAPMILDYFHPNKNFSNDEHFMKIPIISKNFCVLTNRTYEKIRFGENLFLSCDVSFNEHHNITTESNFTQICSALQEAIFHFMLNEYQQNNETNEISFMNKISEFGNPKNDSKYWTEAKLKHGIVDAVQSKYERDENENEFICQNMVLTMSYEFLYASLKVGNFEHQNLIKAVDLVFGTRVDLKFNFNESIKVPIFLDVMFIDLTNSANFSIRSKSLSMIAFMYLIYVLNVLIKKGSI